MKRGLLLSFLDLSSPWRSAEWIVVGNFLPPPQPRDSEESSAVLVVGVRELGWFEQAYTLNRRIKRAPRSDKKCNPRRKDTSVFEHAEGFLYDLSLFQCCSLSRSYWFLLKWWELNGVWASFYSSTGISTIFSSLF